MPPEAKRMLTFLTALALAATPAADPTTVLLWAEPIPGPKSFDVDNVPTLEVHLVSTAQATGCAVVVCPGGGYSGRATAHEGTQVADWLNKRGVHAVILKYRTVNESKVA